MNALIELVRIAKPNKQLLKGKILSLVEGIERGKITCKEDAISILFKDSAEAKRSLSYLIRRTKKSLSLSVITSIKSTSDSQRAYNEAHGGFATVMMLLGKGSRKAAIPEAKRILQIACNYEFINIASALAMKLTKHYAEAEPNKILQRKYAKLAQYYADLIQDSTLSNNHYAQAIIAINNRSSYSKGTISLLEKICTELADKINTVEIATQYYTLKAVRYFAIQDYPAAALISNQVLNDFENKPAVQKGHKIRFLLFQSVAAIAAGQHDSAETCLSKAIDIAGNHLINWQMLTYYRAVNALHAKHYFRAQYFRDQAAKRQQINVVKEYWSVFNAYLYFFNGGSFRLGKFFNETIDVSQDKAGLNVNIIIADLLISITDKRDRFLHRIESVRTYAYRHLKGKANERVRFFLDMLFLIPKHDFDQQRIEKATRHIRLKLARRSVYANHNLEIEIVPFEDLWEKVMERMEVKRRRNIG